MSAKRIPLTTWAARNYDPPPSAWVLRKWCRNGEIVPAPEIVSREGYVREDARRVTATGSLVDRLQAA